MYRIRSVVIGKDGKDRKTTIYDGEILYETREEAEEAQKIAQDALYEDYANYQNRGYCVMIVTAEKKAAPEKPEEAKTQTKKAILLDAGGMIRTVEVPADRDWKWYSRQIGCDYIENVYPEGLAQPYMMIVDEEGALKHRPVMNAVASVLYGAQRHGCPIFGNALIMKTVMTDDGPDVDGLTDEDVAKVMDSLPVWYERIPTKRTR